jgi:hypothetical protein
MPLSAAPDSRAPGLGPWRRADGRAVCRIQGEPAACPGRIFAASGARERLPGRASGREGFPACSPAKVPGERRRRCCCAVLPRQRRRLRSARSSRSIRPRTTGGSHSLIAASVPASSARPTDFLSQCLAWTMTRSLRTLPVLSRWTRSRERSRPRSGARVCMSHCTFWWSGKSPFP